ncbi:MAG TPA: hypothetical protein VFV67_34100 [Actinophytocola sp.]|uniref:hypothetical protein n=1 Tax=Actinophytocola sp. TaxID=1872138 RepID=UPI002DBC3FB7|nr:hypothetical protein [Actinophytocola sp.]HEU5475701.1 hypothetical protein [Actinophytocola sp.]
MATFERRSGDHVAARVRTYDDGEIAKHRRLAEDGVDGWRELPEDERPAPAKSTPKQALQADAAALGLETEGTVKELTERIDAKVAELRKQAAELGIDDDKLSAVELSAAIDAKLAE